MKRSAQPHKTYLSSNSIRRLVRGGGTILALTIVLLPCSRASQTPIFPAKLASVGIGGTQADGSTSSGGISSDGRFVALDSRATNLVVDDENDESDIFVYDTQENVVERVSTDSEGLEADGRSFDPAISADGRYVCFRSTADNLVPGDSNGNWDVFVKDRQTGEVVMASVSSDEIQGEGSGGDAASYYNLAISGNGLVVAYGSDATNLVDGDTNGETDVFVRDLVAGTTERISVALASMTEADGPSEEPSLSYDGQYVAFVSSATNLIGSDSNGARDVFRRDRTEGTTILISQNSSSAQGDQSSDKGTISADGNLVTFYSGSTNLDLVSSDTNGVKDIFVRDVTGGTTVRISISDSGVESDDHCYGPSISPNGRYVSFSSEGTVLTDGDTNGLEDIFRFDRQLSTLSIVSHAANGTPADDYSTEAVVSDNGITAFLSEASNLGPTDTNGFSDVYVEGRALYSSPAPQPAAKNAALVKKIEKQIAKAKSALKKANRGKKKAKAKKLKKKLKKLKKALKKL